MATRRAVKKRVQRLLSGGRGPLVTDFAPRGRSQSVIYAVRLREHPSVVKVGQTTRWENRRKAYANWNLSSGDGIDAERVFVLTEEFIDLPKLEAHILASLPFDLRHGKEWFIADLEDVVRRIDCLLCEAGISYL